MTGISMIVISIITNNKQQQTTTNINKQQQTTNNLRFVEKLLRTVTSLYRGGEVLLLSEPLAGSL
jgi:hypothetical protein